MKAKQGDTVRVHYKGSLEDGEVFDSSSGRAPLEFTIGEGNIIPGFEEAVVGMQPGDSKTEKIPPERAYGARRDDLEFEVDKARIPPELELQVGQQLKVEGPDGEVSRVTVSQVSDSAVTLDANHPLAGRDLVFEIELLEILAA
jgi:peptidylprolyl isomerase